MAAALRAVVGGSDLYEASWSIFDYWGLRWGIVRGVLANSYRTVARRAGQVIAVLVGDGRF